MQKTNLYITGCILGEVGSENSSRITSSGIYVEGSGGYFWSSDTTFIVALNASVTTYVRSQGNSMFLFGYSAMTTGIAQGTDNSILMVAQCSLPQDPVAYDGSDVWFGNINSPESAYKDDQVPITGSAWIDKGPTSILMDFNYYRVYYQKNGDNAWTQIGGEYNQKVRNGQLAVWNTDSLEAGQYVLKLSVTDNTTNLNTLDALKNVNLLPNVFSGIKDKVDKNEDINIYPNPVDRSSIISYQLFENSSVSLKLFDYTGRVIRNYVNEELAKGQHELRLNADDLKPGIYNIHLIAGGNCFTRKIVVM